MYRIHINRKSDQTTALFTIIFWGSRYKRVSMVEPSFSFNKNGTKIRFLFLVFKMSCFLLIILEQVFINVMWVYVGSHG